MPLVYADEDVAATVMGVDSWHGTYAEIMGMGAQEEYMRNHGMGQRRPGRARLVQPDVASPQRVAKAERYYAAAVRLIARARAHPAAGGYGNRIGKLDRASIRVRARIDAKQFPTRAGRLYKRARALLAAMQAGRGVGDLMYMPPTPQMGALYEAGMGASLWEAIGLQSPLSRYTKKGMSHLQIFARFRAIHVQANQRIAGIPRGGVQERLQKQSRSLEKLRSALEPVFSAGAKAGSRDIKNLEAYVSGVKSLRAAVNAQVKVYGLRAVPDEEAISPAAVAAAEPAKGLDPLLLIIPLAAALVL